MTSEDPPVPPGKHRAPRRRGRGHAPQPPPPATPPTADPEVTSPPGLRLVSTHEDVLADPVVELLPATPEVTVIYPGGEKLKVPIKNGMVLSLSCENGEPRIGVNLA